MSVADMREICGENASKVPYIAPLLDETPIKDKGLVSSPYLVDQKDQSEEITDEHLITLGRHQQQFLGSFKPKPKETANLSANTPLSNQDKENITPFLHRPT